MGGVFAPLSSGARMSCCEYDDRGLFVDSVTLSGVERLSLQAEQSQQLRRRPLCRKSIQARRVTRRGGETGRSSPTHFSRTRSAAGPAGTPTIRSAFDTSPTPSAPGERSVLLVAFVSQHDHCCDHGANRRANRQRTQGMLAHLANNEFRSLAAALRCAFGELTCKFLRAA